MDSRAANEDPITSAVDPIWFFALDVVCVLHGGKYGSPYTTNKIKQNKQNKQYKQDKQDKQDRQTNGALSIKILSSFTCDAKTD